MDKWTGGSGKNGWKYETFNSNNGQVFVINVSENPITDFEYPVMFDKEGSVLNGEIYYEPTDEYFAASGPVTFPGLKSILRDIMSQVEMAESAQEDAESTENENIYGY
jgi:hypothetical protein